MKKIIAFTLITLLSTAAFASKGGFNGPTSAQGGFNGPSAATTTVAQALTMKDDTRVLLTGTIEQHLGGKDYLFKDATGSVTVEIGPRQWQGLVVSPSDVVEIYGKVDKDFTSFEIDVKQIRKVEPTTAK